jgi:hypothetical protein
MNKHVKNNVIKFPNRMAETIGERVLESMDKQEECAHLGRLCVDIITKTIRNEPTELMSDLDFNDIKSDEYKDMFVILNLLVSMFLRKSDINHILQKDLNNVYYKLLSIDFASKNDIDWEEQEKDDLPPIS